MRLFSKLKDIILHKNIKNESLIEQAEYPISKIPPAAENNATPSNSSIVSCSVKFENLSDYELNKNELCFFESLVNQTLAADISGIYTAIRNSGGGYSIEFTGDGFGCWVGRIFLPEKSYNFAVIKDKNKKASRVFDNLAAAEYYLKTHPADLFKIEKRDVSQEKSMQYLYGKAEESRFVYGDDISKYIKAIRYWIWYIKRTKKESDFFLRQDMYK